MSGPFYCPNYNVLLDASCAMYKNTYMKRKRDTYALTKSPIIEQIPAACSDELLAVEFLEAQRWGDSPECVHCLSKNVYKMIDAKTGERNKRFLWRCRECRKQFTVRLGTVYE